MYIYRIFDKNYPNVSERRFEIMTKPFPVMGFDIGGTKIAICLCMSDGTLIGSSRVSNHERAPEDVLPELVAAGKKLLEDAGIPASELRAIGIGSPSPMDWEKGVILGPFNMPLWKHVEIRDYLSNAFGVEAFFDNDANAAASVLRPVFILA